MHYSALLGITTGKTEKNGRVVRSFSAEVLEPGPIGAIVDRDSGDVLQACDSHAGAARTSETIPIRIES